MKKNDRVVPKKNYFILLVLIVMIVVVTFLVFNINDKYQNRKLNTNYLSGYINEITDEDIDNIMTETTTDFFVLITEVGNEDIYKFETQLKKIIKKQDLRDNFVLINKNEDISLDDLNSKFNSDIKKIPAIIYFKDGEFVKSIDSEEDILKAEDFDQLLDEYEIKEN